MLESERLNSDWEKWDPDLSLHKNDRFDIEVDLATPLYRVADIAGEFICHFKWRVILRLTGTQTEYFSCVHKTEYSLKLTKEEPTIEDITSLCSKSFTFFTIAYKKRIVEEINTPTNMGEFSKDAILPVIGRVLDTLRHEYNLLR